MSVNKFNFFSILRSSVNSLFIGVIFIYRTFWKPLFGGYAVCRFEPSCSEYSAQAFKTFSTPKAIKLTIKRMLKCHPCGSYGYDPLPCCSEK